MLHTTYHRVGYTERCDINELETSLYQVILYNDNLARLDSFYQVSILYLRFTMVIE